MRLARAACLGWALALALSACGKYGPPVRRAPAASPSVSAVQPTAGETAPDEDREESKK